MRVPVPNLQPGIARHVGAAATAELLDPLILALGDLAHDAHRGPGETAEPQRRPGRRAQPAAERPTCQLNADCNGNVCEHNDLTHAWRAGLQGQATRSCSSNGALFTTV